MKKLFIFGLILAVISLNLFSQDLMGIKKAKVTASDVEIVKEDALPVVGSFQNLKQILQKAEKSGRRLQGEVVALDAMESVMAIKRETSNGAAKSMADFSTTNIQVTGVDEADIAKTDGKYLYQITGQEAVISQVYPAEEMKVLKRVSFEGQRFSPQELYVDEKHLILIGNTFYEPRQIPEPKKNFSNQEERILPEIYPPQQINETMKAIVYDITDKENINKLREIEVEGYYLSSRKIGSSIYFVTNKYIDYYHILEGNQELATPVYRDSLDKDFTQISYSDIQYFPGSEEPNYLMVAGLNLEEPNKALSVNTYLGSGQNVYATENSLYVALTIPEEEKKESKETKETKEIEPSNSPDEATSSVANGEITILPVRSVSTNTEIYKFALNQGQIKYEAKGKVPGTIINQFAMDENDEYFRIATTKGEIWRNENTSKNNIYVLDKKLNVVGSLENLAPGEKIYSVRFMGQRAYMVTFKTVDPLFVISLENPAMPKVLGELKIPGYSDYLQPYDENHIIGFGKEAIVVSDKQRLGTDEPVALYQGFKMAIFDITDVTKPVEKFKEVIGDRGTESEILHNHKALLFAKEKDLLAFPITVAEFKAGKEKDPFEYGEIFFQGAYVYNLTLAKGFNLKAKLSQVSNKEDIFRTNRNVERVIYIGDNLYTISQGMIIAYNLKSLQEIGKLSIRN